VHVDNRDGLSPGFKFNDWEMRGVPIRLEIGPRDVEGQSVMAGRRDVPGKDGKQIIPVAELTSRIPALLDDIQAALLREATEFRDAHLHEVNSYDELKAIVGKGWGLMRHCATPECEDKIKEETKATCRCFPLDENPEWNPVGAKCAVCGKPAFGKAYFARAY
jgi:prolyl-tRNA synthetase